MNVSTNPIDPSKGMAILVHSVIDRDWVDAIILTESCGYARSVMNAFDRLAHHY